MSEHERHLCDTCRQEEYDSFRHACVHESMAQNDVWLETYKISDWPRWDYSMEDSTLVFSSEGKPHVICRIEVVGSTKGKTWEWSWGNETLPLACRQRMSEIYELGEEKEWDRLTTLFLDSDEFVGWECASIASHVLNGIAVYKCPNSGGNGEDAVYVTVLSASFVN